MKIFKNSRKAGISLVALVITIIVLIILTGAVIVTFMEGGIIDRAKEAVFKSDIRTYQEILALKRAENQMEIGLGEKEPEEINASTLAEIQKIIPEFKEEYEGIFEISNGELVLVEGYEEVATDIQEECIEDLRIKEAPVTDVVYNTGDEVSITDNEGKEHNFYVMEDSGRTLKLLAKGTINTTTYTQESPNIVVFSDTNYWYKNGEYITYDLNNYEVVKTEGQEGKAYALEAAIEYGEKLGGIGRLMTHEEAESWQDGGELQTKLYEAGTYWLGSASVNGHDSTCVWTVIREIETLGGNASYYGGLEVRPVITISESAVN